MVKVIAQNMAQQLKQLGEDVLETARKQPQELAGKVLEQMGGGSPPPSGSQKIPQVSDEAKKLEEMKAVDRGRSEQLAGKIVQELEAEIEKWRRIREEQLKARRQQEEQKKEEKKQETPPLIEPSTKPKRGLFFGFWGRRAQRAREQTQPEMAGRRVGG